MSSSSNLTSSETVPREKLLKWSNRLGLPSNSVMIGKYPCVYLGKLPVNGTMLIFDSCVGFFSKLIGSARDVFPLESIVQVVMRNTVHQLVIVLKSGQEHVFTAFVGGKRQQCARMINGALEASRKTQKEKATKTANQTQGVVAKTLAKEPAISSSNGDATPDLLVSTTQTSESSLAVPEQLSKGVIPLSATDSSQISSSGRVAEARGIFEQGDKKPAPEVIASVAQADLEHTRLPTASSLNDVKQTGAETPVEPTSLVSATQIESQNTLSEIDGAAYYEEEADEEYEEEEEEYLWIQEGDVIDYKHGVCYDAKKQVAQYKFGVNIREMFEYIYQCGEKVYRDFHEKKMGDWDVQISEWKSVDGHRERSGSFSKKLGYSIGPKQTRVTEKSFLTFTSSGFRMEVEGHNRDVPMGDSFRVESYFEFTGIDDETSEATAYLSINFIARNMFKKQVENGALTDTAVAYTKFFEALNEGAVEYIKNKQAQKAKPRSSSCKKVSEEKEAELPPLPEVPAIVLEWAEDGKDSFDKPRLETFNERQEVARDVMPCSAKMAFNALMLQEGSEELYKGYFVQSGEHDWIMDPWSFKDNCRTRKLNYKKPLNIAMVHKDVNCFETHYLNFTSSGGFIYEVDLFNPDVPTGNTFRVHSFWEFIPKNEQATEVAASVAVHWVGKSMFKKRIESGAVSDVTVSYARFLTIAKQMCIAFEEKINAASRPAPARTTRRAGDLASKPRSKVVRKQVVYEKIEVEAVHDSSSFAMNLILIFSFVLILWLLLAVIQISNTVSEEILFLQRVQGL